MPKIPITPMGGAWSAPNMPLRASPIGRNIAVMAAEDPTFLNLSERFKLLMIIPTKIVSKTLLRSGRLTVYSSDQLRPDAPVRSEISHLF